MMIATPIQSKLAAFNNAFNNALNQECDEIIKRSDAATAPDRYWILTHESDQLYTYGTNEETQLADSIPAQINGIAVQPQTRTGGITYHGPGQISWSWLINYRRLRRLHDTRSQEFSIQKLMQTFRNVVNAEFNQNLILNPGDPGFYTQQGEKILSFGVYLASASWIAVKVSLNLHVDLNVYNNVAICGVQNRSMGNLMSTLPSIPEQQKLGQRLLHTLWDNIYTDYHLTDWTD